MIVFRKIVDVVLPYNAVSLDVSIDRLALGLQPFVCYDYTYDQLKGSLKQPDYDMSFSGMKYSFLKKENGYIDSATGLKPNTTDTLGVKSVSPNGGWGWAVPAKTKHTAEVASS